MDQLLSPVRYLIDHAPGLTPAMLRTLRMYEQWWEHDGKAISAAVDRAGTPHVRMFDVQGRRVDDILFPPDYWRMLKEGYKHGIVWRAFEDNTLTNALLLHYVTCFYDLGVDCPYTVSLSTALPLDKYGSAEAKARFLPRLLAKDDSVWQGATWMTEARGGSDLGATVDTLARQDGDGWRLTGDKYFCSNAGAELAVVAARVGDTAGVRGLALFLVPRLRADGTLNYYLRRLKDKIATRSVPTGEIELRDSEAYLLGAPEQGIYLILEVLNTSRIANAIGSTALAQRCVADALAFARERRVFGKPLAEQPLMRQQLQQRQNDVDHCFALAWEALRMYNGVYRETPPYSDSFHLFRLVCHLAKYWTAEVAVQTAKWAMEVHGGMGTLAEYGVERWLREAMIADIWEGPPHRQMLDALEVMARKNAHHALLEYLQPYADAVTLQDVAAEWDRLLTLPPDEREARVQPAFERLARFSAEALHLKLQAAQLEGVLREEAPADV